MAMPVHEGTRKIIRRECPEATKATKISLHQVFVYETHIVIYVITKSSKAAPYALNNGQAEIKATPFALQHLYSICVYMYKHICIYIYRHSYTNVHDILSHIKARGHRRFPWNALSMTCTNLESPGTSPKSQNAWLPYSFKLTKACTAFHPRSFYLRCIPSWIHFTCQAHSRSILLWQDYGGLPARILLGSRRPKIVRQCLKRFVSRSPQDIARWSLSTWLQGNLCRARAGRAIIISLSASS